MFRPAKIFSATIIIKEDKVDELVQKLHELGICEFKQSKLDMDTKYSYEIVRNLDSVISRFDFIKNSLEDYQEIVQPDNRMKNFLFPDLPKKHKSTAYTTSELIEEVEHHLGMIEPKVIDRLEKLGKIKEEMQKNQLLIDDLSLVPSIHTSVFKSSENIRVFLGLVNTKAVSKIKAELGNNVFGIRKINKSQSLVTIMCDANDTSIEKRLHTVGFQSLEILYEDKNPKEIIDRLRSDIEKLKEERAKIKSFLTRAHKLYKKKLQLFSEELQIMKDKSEALKKFSTTNAVSVMEAWVPEKDFKKFKLVVEETSKEHYIEIEEKEDAPTLFNNNKFVKPFEMVTELYSAPKYGDFDPTPFLAITFTLFFGFMLTDAVYGLLVIAIGWIMYKGIGKINESMNNFAKILILFGISTTVMGIIFGSYFGNFFQAIGINLPVPIDAMKEVMKTLSIALALGFIHLGIGLFIGIYENFRTGNVRNGLMSQGVWIVLMIAITLFLLKMNTAGLVVLGISFVMQVVLNFMDGGAVSSLLSIFGFTGFIGDLFSYARLMALALGTAGIALAVNFMVILVFGIPWIGWLIAILVFLIGHIFNVAMNGLGAFIHSVRLHFLEFFTKFYDGGGRKYAPFRADREITQLGGGN